MSVAAPSRLIAVTTRSRLRSLRFLPVMLLATWRVRRQLGRAPGIVRWASVVAGPREFWTLTVWRSRHDMQEFMRSGAHGEIMWQLPRWLRSFWLMRWRPGERELGSWAGVELAVPRPQASASPRSPRALADALPCLRDALDETGRLSYDSSPLVRRSRAHLTGAAGAVVRVRTSPSRLPGALRALRRLRRLLRTDEALLRAVVGIGGVRECYLFGVWSEESGAARLLEGAWARAARTRWGAGFWAHEWLPENEFGHWDGLRVRAERRLRARRPRARGSGAGRPPASPPRSR